MVRPISLRLRHAEILAKARATLIRGGRGDELKRAHTAAVMRKARTIVERRQEQDRLRRIAVLAGQKAVLAVKQAYAAGHAHDCCCGLATAGPSTGGQPPLPSHYWRRKT